MGTRLCPPARTLASSPSLDSSARAAPTLSGASYSNAAGFTSRSSSARARASRRSPCSGSAGGDRRAAVIAGAGLAAMRPLSQARRGVLRESVLCRFEAAGGIPEEACP